MTDLVVINGQNVSFEVVGDQTYTTSLNIAAVFEKRHDNIIAQIKRLPNDDFNALNFKVVEYKDAKGEMRKCYKITRDGFVMLAMGFTGDKAYRFKVEYINAFNKMEQMLKDEKIQQIKQNQLSFNKTIPQEMRKRLAENGYLLLDRNAFCGLTEGLGARVCDGLRQILGNYPSCLGQLATVTAYGALNYYETKIMQTLGTNITPWGVNCCVANIELRKADNCYSPIYNKWVIEDGKQDPRWELELKWKGDKKSSYGS